MDNRGVPTDQAYVNLVNRVVKLEGAVLGFPQRQAEREQFDAWRRTVPNGVIFDGAVNAAWLAWQAAWKAAQASGGTVNGQGSRRNYQRPHAIGG